MLKILTFLLLMAVSAESISNLWIKAETSIVQIEKSEKKDNKDGETEKEDNKDKLFQHFTTLRNESEKQMLFVLDHIHFKYSAFLSLPEIPPELV